MLVKGKHEPVSIHTINAGASPEELRDWNEGLALYRQGRFGKALPVFERLFAATDNGLYDLYACRCRTLAEDPPGPDWCGVFEHTTK